MPCPRYEYLAQQGLPSLFQRLAARNEPNPKVEQAVSSIFSAVRNDGDQALVAYTRSFDSQEFDSTQIKVPLSSLEASLHAIPQSDIDVIEEAAANIRAFHSQQKEHSWVDHTTPGLITGQLLRPVDRAGLYVPGGRSGDTPLISSLLMNAIPAQVAGVERIIIATPPRPDGKVNPYTLAAAAILGLNEVYALGSAWAIVALGYGTETVPAVDVVTGPGNIYVATAKRFLTGQVAIDMIAGPSEIAIVADESADPEWLAADLLSQAEHDPLASALLISPEQDILDRTQAALERQLASLPRQEIAASALKDWGGLIKVPDLRTAVELTNNLAPEHLQLCLGDPWSMLGHIKHAGAIFLGQYTPEPLGDYFAGPNHVLPTMGSARFASALSVHHYMKKSSVIAASPEYSRRHGSKVARLARLEGLEAHARSAEIRDTE